MSNTITRAVLYRTLNVEGLEIFYREAGRRDAPTHRKDPIVFAPRDQRLTKSDLISLGTGQDENLPDQWVCFCIDMHSKDRA